MSPGSVFEASTSRCSSRGFAGKGEIERRTGGWVMPVRLGVLPTMGRRGPRQELPGPLAEGTRKRRPEHGPPWCCRFRKGSELCELKTTPDDFSSTRPRFGEAAIQLGSSSSSDRCFQPFGFGIFPWDKNKPPPGRCQERASKKKAARWGGTPPRRYPRAGRASHAANAKRMQPPA
jgi:hypothetical protein